MNIYFQKRFQRGFGTYPLKGDTLRQALDAAIGAGYRAFDTAQMYGNEAETGAALAACGVAREDLCITTKVHPDNYSAETFLPSVEASLKALQIDPFGCSSGRTPAMRKRCSESRAYSGLAKGEMMGG